MCIIFIEVSGNALIGLSLINQWGVSYDYRQLLVLCVIKSFLIQRRPLQSRSYDVFNTQHEQKLRRRVISSMRAEVVLMSSSTF